MKNFCSLLFLLLCVNCPAHAGTKTTVPTTESTGDGMGGKSAYGVANDFQPFKSTPGYHGEFFIHPETGTIVRLIVQVDMKPEDPVKQEDTRIDYAPVTVGGTTSMAPVELMEFSSVSLTGESSRRMSVRRSLVDRKYTFVSSLK